MLFILVYSRANRTMRGTARGLRGGRVSQHLIGTAIFPILGLFVKRIGACSGVCGAHSSSKTFFPKATQSGSITLGLIGSGLSRRL
jgi:hypothetical protein